MKKIIWVSCCWRCGVVLNDKNRQMIETTDRILSSRTCLKCLEEIEHKFEDVGGVEYD